MNIILEELPLLDKDYIKELIYVFDENKKVDNSIEFTTKFSIRLQTKLFNKEFEESLNVLKKNGFFILKERLLEKRTLQDVANCQNISRERVRQIENDSIKRLAMYMPRELLFKVRDTLVVKKIVCKDDIPLKEEHLNIFINVISHPKFPKRFTYDSNFDALIPDSSSSYKEIKKKLKSLLLSFDKYICTQEEVLDYISFISNNIEPSFILKKFLENGDMAYYENNRLFMKSSLTTKNKIAEFIYSLFPEGFDTYKRVDEFRSYLIKYFPEKFDSKTKDRTITGLVSLSEKIVLWEWGKYIHIRYIQDILENYDFSDLIRHIDNELNSLLSVDITGFFNEHKELLIEFGISTEHTLYTLLKLQYPDNYNYLSSPRVALVGTEKFELKEILLDTMNSNKIYSIEELIGTLKSPFHRIQQLIDRTDEIISVDTQMYINKKFINISNDLLDEIIIYLNIKVKELDFIYVGLVIDEFRTKLNSISEYSLEITLLDLLKKYNVKKDFNISNKRIVNKDYVITRHSLNFHYLLDQFMYEKNQISKNELFEYFYIRGLDARVIMNYYLYSRLKLLVRIDEETFVKLNYIGIDESKINKINALVEANFTNNVLELRIDELIKKIKTDIPNIVIDWNRFILCDILYKDLFRVLPSAENPQYIELKKDIDNEEIC